MLTPKDLDIPVLPDSSGKRLLHSNHMYEKRGASPELKLSPKKDMKSFKNAFSCCLPEISWFSGGICWEFHNTGVKDLEDCNEVDAYHKRLASDLKSNLKTQ